jgi:Family of unknown function (DUF6527)
MRIELQHVRFMPKDLKPGVLYASEEFGAAAHLCACGCGAKIRTPLGPTDWTLEETESGPTLYPSVGNWQQACQSHYWISEGKVIWAGKWTDEQIETGRRREKKRQLDYYDALDGQRGGAIRKFSRWVNKMFKS